MGKIKACIFDLDGVLVDTAQFHYIAWKRLANSLGFDFTKNDNERLKGVSRQTSLNILLEIGGVKYSKERMRVLADQKNSWYVEYITKMTERDILPGINSFINDIKIGGFKLGLGSASKNALTILDRTGLDKYFDSIIDGNKVSKAKPDPEVFITGAKELGVQPAECVVFEDATAGVEAALKGGFYAIGVGSSSVLQKAHFVIEDFAEMNLQVFENIVEKIVK